MSRDAGTILDIVKAVELALDFLGGSKKEDFLKDGKTQSASLHQLMLLGEGVKRLSEAFRTKHSEIPWKMIAGMRDRLIHGYDDVDLEEVWKTLTVDLPGLFPKLRRLIPR